MGFDLTLWVQTQGASLASSSLKIAQLIQGDLARIGVNVRIVQLLATDALAAARGQTRHGPDELEC